MHIERVIKSDGTLLRQMDGDKVVYVVHEDLDGTTLPYDEYVKRCVARIAPPAVVYRRKRWPLLAGLAAGSGAAVGLLELVQHLHH